MEYRSLGCTGMMVSTLCVGTFNFSDSTDEQEALSICERAADVGINFFDTANAYHRGGSERVLGKALATLGRRDKFVIATKVHNPVGDGPNDRGNSRRHVIQACEDSLRRLGTDYIDLYQLHQPSFDIPIEETLGALDDLIRHGKVRYIGTSNHPAWKVMEGLMVADRKGLARFVSEQPPYNLLDRRIENELVPLCKSHGLGIICYAPLAQGVLVGRYADASKLPPDSRAARLGGSFVERVNAQGIEVGNKLSSLSKQFGLDPAQFALLWVKEQPGVTAAILGARTIAQLDLVVPTLEMRLTDEMRACCDDLVPPGSAVTNFHNVCSWMKQRT